jgi:hypothetical protein
MIYYNYILFYIIVNNYEMLLDIKIQLIIIITLKINYL